MKIILFGSPGSGKGTQAAMLAEYLNIKRVSLGDILREEVEKDSQLGRKVKSYMEGGLLVPDNLVSRVIEENINIPGFILEGYPRNLEQAKRLEDILKKSNADVDFFIYLDIDQKIIIDRLDKRRICRSCGANYHLENMSSEKEGICDSCGGELIQRKDDNPEVIKKRWEVFSNESKSILDFYQLKGKLVNIDGRGNKLEIFERVKKILR